MEYSIIHNLFFLFIGCLVGVFTGLLPGIHPNTLIPITILLYGYISPQNYLYFLLGLVITHYFVSYIPSAFIGVPEDETAVSVLPLHNLTKKGRGYEGIMLCAFGGFIGIIMALIITFLIFNIGLDLDSAYVHFKPYIPYVLILLLITSLLFSENIFWSTLIVILSGLFGIVALYKPPEISNILTAIFTGMFGIPLLLENLKGDKVRRQILTFPELDTSLIKSAFAGTIGGLFRIFLPAIGGAQINFFLGKIIKENNLKGFLVSQGAITLSNEVFSILSLLLIGYGRSGTAVAIKDLSINLDNSIIFSLLIASGSAFGILCLISRYFLNYLPYLDYRKITYYIMSFCILVVLLLGYFSGYLLFYIAVFIVASFIGILCLKSKVNMSYMMSVLVFPTILYYLF